MHFKKIENNYSKLADGFILLGYLYIKVLEQYFTIRADNNRLKIRHRSLSIKIL